MIRFRRVSKSLDSSITTPYFILTPALENSRSCLILAYQSQALLYSDLLIIPRIMTTRSLHETEVDTLSSDSWRRVGFNLKPDLKFFDKDHFLPTPLVSGNLHWIAVMREGEENHKNKNMIMSFDVNSEVFRKLALPRVSIDANNLHRCLASFKGKLAFITSEHMGNFLLYHFPNKLIALPLPSMVHFWLFASSTAVH